MGPEYRPGGVMALGLNLRDAGGLLIEYEITYGCGNGEGVLDRLQSGYRTALGSPFGYRSVRSLASVDDWVLGRGVRDHETLVRTMRACARLQAVKCSPEDGNRSTPTAAMVANCPGLLLENELNVLKPGAIVGFGLEADVALSALGYDPKEGTDYLSWGDIEVAGQTFPVFWLYHPSGRYWSHSQRELVDELRRRLPRAS